MDQELNKTVIGKARQLPSVDWQHHFAAAMELIKLRGGLASLAHSSEYLKPLILHLLM